MILIQFNKTDETTMTMLGRNVRLTSDKIQTSVEVSRSKRFGSNEFSPAEINWPGCGNRSVEWTKEINSMLMVAVLIGTALDNDVNADGNMLVLTAKALTGLDIVGKVR